MNPENSRKAIASLFDAHAEWLLVDEAGVSFALRRDEIEFETVRGQAVLGFLTAGGFTKWKVADWKESGKKLSFWLERNLGREKRKFDFVPRTEAAEYSAALEIARIQRANQLAKMLVDGGVAKKLVRASLAEENSRFARIIFARPDGGEAAALADVTETLTHESLLALAVQWLLKLQSRRKKPIDKIVILTNSKTAKRLAKLRTTLCGGWQESIRIVEYKNDGGLKELRSPRLTSLLGKKPSLIKALPGAGQFGIVDEITALAPDAIDAVYSRQGVTLRYLGLPFARVRKVAGEERMWFGVEAVRRPLTVATGDEFAELFEDLKTYRSAASLHNRHRFYQLAPEGWLDSILRRNIKRLDANLVLSPIYHQFRISADKIDLLALREDGRLVVIELKVAPDREMIYQAVDYWLKIESQRIAGNIQKAGVFEDRTIADRPAIIYLVAPRLSYHPDFDLFARTISDEIEIYRFALNETWRENLKVAERMS